MILFDLRYDPIIINTKIATIVLSTISLLFSSSVVFILIAKFDKLVSNKALVHIILSLAISDSMISFAYALGYPYGILCNIQGFLAETFEKCTWLLIDILMINVYWVVIYRRTLIDSKYVYITIASVVILLTFLPLIDSVGYGAPIQGISRCSFVDYNDPYDFKNVSTWVYCSKLYLYLVSFLYLY